MRHSEVSLVYPSHSHIDRFRSLPFNLKSFDETEVDFGDEDEEQDVQMIQAEQEESEEEGEMQAERKRRESKRHMPN